MKCSNCWSETFECSACGSLVEPWGSVVPEPVDREALERRIRRIYIDGGAHIAHAQEAATEITDAVLAVLAGEQEQARG